MFLHITRFYHDTPGINECIVPKKKIKKRQGHYSYCAPNVTDCLTSFVHHWTNETFLKKYSRHPFSTWFLTGHPVFLYSNSKKFQYQIFNLSINIHQLARNLWFVSPISSRGEKKLNTIITTTFLNNLGNAMSTIESWVFAA